jgi:hypothetical protein
MNLPIKANFAVITGRRGFFLSAWLLCACLVSVASMSLAAALSAPQGSLPSQSFELDF